jgi:hypothetical protein
MNTSPKLPFVALVAAVFAVIAVSIIARRPTVPARHQAATPFPVLATDERPRARQRSFEPDVWLENYRSNQRKQEITEIVEKLLDERLMTLQNEQAFNAAPKEERIEELEDTVRLLNDRVVRSAYELQEIKEALRKARERAIYRLPE